MANTQQPKQESLNFGRKAAVVAAVGILATSTLYKPIESFFSNIIEEGKQDEAIIKKYSDPSLLEKRTKSGLQEGEVIVVSSVNDTEVEGVVAGMQLTEENEEAVKKEFGGQVGGYGSFEGGDAAVLPAAQLNMDVLMYDDKQERLHVSPEGNNIVYYTVKPQQ